MREASLFRPPTLFIFALVAMSMASAVFIHRWMHPSDGSAELASRSVSGAEAGRSELERITRAATGDSEPSDADCNCITEGQSPREFSFETEQTCDSRRLYLQNSKAMSEISENFRETRSVRPAEFNRICVTYIMRHYDSNEEIIDGAKPVTPEYALCPDPVGKPERTAWPPCVTEEYVNIAYNTFGDVMSCLQIPQKEYLPKLLQESGMISNTLSAGYDAGFGQLTIGAVPEDYIVKEVKEEVMSSTDPACQRIQKQLSKFDLSLFENNDKTGNKVSVSNRCSLIAMPNNPLMNIFFMAVKFREDQRAVDTYFRDKSEFTSSEKGARTQSLDLEDMIKLSGLAGSNPSTVNDNAQEIYEKLKQIVMIHSYNLGPRKAAILLRNFFLDRLHHGKSVRRSDFNFHVDLAKYRLRVNTHPTPKDLTYPEYIFVHYPAGAGGAKSYLVRMAAAADLLNQKFKEGTCVAESYLAL